MKQLMLSNSGRDAQNPNPILKVLIYAEKDSAG